MTLRTEMPYLNNARVIAATVAVNLLCMFIFQWGRDITIETILIDAANAGAITSFINVIVAGRRIKKLRGLGRLPSEVPVISQMSLLPQNPLLLSLVFAVVFGLLTPAANLIVMRGYGIETLTFERFAVWKAFYVCCLSAFILEWAALRYVQPDCAGDGAVEQSGDEGVNNPLRHISSLKEVYNTAIDDFGFNMLIGVFLGGTVIRGYEVVVLPTARSGIVVSGVIIGLIVTLRMALPIAQKMLAMRERGELPVSPQANCLVSWLPRSPMKFALALMPPLTVSCILVFWAVLTFFGFETLNFFQFFFIRVMFISLLGKLVVRLAIARYTQE